MAHFAKLGIKNIVEKIIVVENSVITDNSGIEQESLGVDFINKLFNTQDIWKQTSYNRNFRKNFAGVGFTYNQQRDAFIPPKPFNSWVLNEQTCLWESPVPLPQNTNIYLWNEITQNWDLQQS